MRGTCAMCDVRCATCEACGHGPIRGNSALVASFLGYALPHLFIHTLQTRIMIAAMQNACLVQSRPVLTQKPRNVSARGTQSYQVDVRV